MKNNSTEITEENKVVTPWMERSQYTQPPTYNKHSLRETKHRVEQSGNTMARLCQTLAEQGTQWYFLASKLHNS